MKTALIFYKEPKQF